MVEIAMIRRGQRLECPTQDWADLLCELPEGVDLRAKVTRARSLKQLGTYWGMLAFAISDGPEWIGQRWPTKDELSDAVQLEVGFVRQISLRGLPPGTFYAVPASKSFAECSQERFNEFFSAAQITLGEWCGFDPVPAYQRWLAERRAA